MMNQNTELRVVNIVSLIPGYKVELVSDLFRLQKECGVTDVAFIMSLHPEEKELSLTKPERLKRLFVDMRDALKDSGLRVGILIQSTLGHGAPSASPLQKSVNAKGMVTGSFCPLAPGLTEYLYDAVSIIASTHPDFLLVDDDFRLANYGAPGCYCGAHLDAFKKMTGCAYDREGLLAALQTDDLLRKQWDDLLLQSLLRLAKEIRSAIDSVDVRIPCGFCICDAGGMESQYAHHIASALAGKNPPFVRLNTAWYWSSDPKALLSRIYWTSVQAKVMGDIPELLAESDTYPHNRYHTPAVALHAQIVFSLLHGCSGLKLWISRLFDHEPASGEAYRKMLAANLGLYRELRRMACHIVWSGPTTPIVRDISRCPAAGSPVRNDNWSCLILSHMGIPATVGDNDNSCVVLLSGGECDLFSNDELMAFMRRGVLLDGAAAVKICARGLGEYLGVRADSPAGWSCSHERLIRHPMNGGAAEKRIQMATLAQGSAVRLTPDAPQTQTLSTLYRSPFYLSEEETAVGAGLTVYENPFGGRVAVYAATLDTTPFMNEVRREQLIHVLDWLNLRPLPVVVLSDLDLYCMYGRLESDGSEVVAITNVNLDTLDEVVLRITGRLPVSIDTLSRDGQWEAVAYHQIAEATVQLELKAACVTPVILRIFR